MRPGSERTDQGRRRRWGWGRPSLGVTPFGRYIEANRRRAGLAQHELAAAVHLSLREYRALIKREVPPPTFDEMTALCAVLSADRVQAAILAWQMDRLEAIEVLGS